MPEAAAELVGLEIEIRHVDTEQCLAWYGNVLMVFSRQPPTFQFMQTIMAELAALSGECGLGTGTLLVISSDVPPPTEEARAYIKRELGRSSMLAAAQVVEGTGFRGAAMRSVLTMIQLTIRPRYAMKIFDSVKAGSIWLAAELRERAGSAPPGRQLASAAVELQQRFFAGQLLPASATYVKAPRM